MITHLHEQLDLWPSPCGILSHGSSLPLIGLTKPNTMLFDTDNQTLGSLIIVVYVSPFMEDP